MSHSDDRDAFLREMLEAGCSEEELAELAGVLAPLQPTADLRKQLLASASAGGRLGRFAAQVATLLDVDEAEAARLLDGIDETASWSDSPLPGVGLYHLKGGPKVTGAITGFIKIERGGRFPHHSHLGDEQVLVVQGRCRDTASGEVFAPGDIVQHGVDDEHELEVLAGPTFVYLAVVFGGLDIGGMVLKPGDPRI